LLPSKEERQTPMAAGFFFCDERDLLVDKEQFHMVYPRLRRYPGLGRKVR
jgi:hypothetical protein